MDYCTAVKKNELELGVLELRDMQEVKRSHCKTPTYGVMPFLERNTGKYTGFDGLCVCKFENRWEGTQWPHHHGCLWSGAQGRAEDLG